MERKWIWVVVLGIVLIVLGAVLLGSPVNASLASVATLGCLMLIAGGIEMVAAFCCLEWSGFFPAVLSGMLGSVVGLSLLGNPIEGRTTLTVLLASFLLVGGIFKAVAAIAHRFEAWRWLRLSGAIDIVLGMLIWRELPTSGLTMSGMLVGASLIFRGVSWLMVGFALKRIPSTAA
jgi:uncharacterized membrane protein HdeD (DUF308 family)